MTQIRPLTNGQVLIDMTSSIDNNGGNSAYGIRPAGSSFEYSLQDWNTYASQVYSNPSTSAAVVNADPLFLIMSIGGNPRTWGSQLGAYYALSFLGFSPSSQCVMILGVTFAQFVQAVNLGTLPQFVMILGYTPLGQ